MDPGGEDSVSGSQEEVLAGCGAYCACFDFLALILLHVLLEQFVGCIFANLSHGGEGCGC